MKTNVTYLEQIPYVNEEKKIVAVRLISEIDLNKIPNMDVFINLPSVQAVLENYPWYVEDENDLGVIGFETVGKSKVVPGSEDVFDAELGRKVASTRAQQKAFSFASDFYAKITNAILDDSEPINYFGWNSACSVDSCDYHVSELLGDKLPEDKRYPIDEEAE